MSSKKPYRILACLLLLLTRSLYLFGQNESPTAGSQPCNHTTKSYPEATCLADLAHVYVDQHEYELAEAVLKRELRVRENAVGPNDPDIVSTLDRLALLYQTEKRFSEGEALLKRGLTTRQKVFGLSNVKVAESMEALADFYSAQKRDAEAENLLKQAFNIEEKALRPSDPAYPTISWTLTDLGRLYQGQKRYSEAEPVFTRALTIYQNAASPNYFNIGDSQFECAIVFALDGKNSEAEFYLKQALATMEKSLGPEHLRLAPVLDAYSALLQRMNRTTEAELLAERANDIRVKAKH